MEMESKDTHINTHTHTQTHRHSHTYAQKHTCTQTEREGETERQRDRETERKRAVRELHRNTNTCIRRETYNVREKKEKECCHALLRIVNESSWQRIECPT